MTRAQAVDSERGCMRHADLAVELALEFCDRSFPTDLGLSRWLRGQGVDVTRVLNVAGPIAEHDVIIRGHRFDFATEDEGDAVRAIVHIANADEDETPVDLIAWMRDQPRRVFQCLGAVEALGVDQIGNAASWFLGKPLAVHRTPLDWLRAGCTGIVIFDATRVRARLECLPARSGGYRLAAVSLEHGRALRKILSPIPDTVQILVPASPHREGAA
jgi:hypothetical protein